MFNNSLLLIIILIVLCNYSKISEKFSQLNKIHCQRKKNDTICTEYSELKGYRQNKNTYYKSEDASLDECMSICSNDKYCIGFDYDNVNHKCGFFDKSVSEDCLEKRSTGNRFTHYIKEGIADLCSTTKCNKNVLTAAKKINELNKKCNQKINELKNNLDKKDSELNKNKEELKKYQKELNDCEKNQNNLLDQLDKLKQELNKNKKNAQKAIQDVLDKERRKCDNLLNQQAVMKKVDPCPVPTITQPPIQQIKLLPESIKLIPSEQKINVNVQMPTGMTGIAANAQPFQSMQSMQQKYNPQMNKNKCKCMNCIRKCKQKKQQF